MTEIARQLGDPDAACTEMNGCAAVFELKDGSFAIIGIDRTDDLLPTLPPDAGVAPYERIVVVDRAVLLAAKSDIPEA